MSGGAGESWSSLTLVAWVHGLFDLLFWPERDGLLLKQQRGLTGHLGAQWPASPQ
jgi:hypothetical protein